MQNQAIGLPLFLLALVSMPAWPQRSDKLLELVPSFKSLEVTPDRHVAFRMFAPKAQQVSVFSTDLFGTTLKSDMTKADNGVWEITIGPIDPGAYRYNFTIDTAAVMDSRVPAVSESNDNTWNMVYVPGADFMETKDVPHGAVASVTYFSKSLNKFRRMHVYTPPGYETSSQKYPVFYLLHGAGDSDDSWTSVGRAGFIIDNLIAAGKAKPMVIVMPAGHTESFNLARTPGTPRALDTDDFVKDFVNDIMPYSEAHYRILRDRQHRAIAGLSMGGAQTLNIAIPHSDEFAYVGVFSSGIFGIIAPPAPPAGQANPGPTWEQQHLAELDNASAKKGLKLFWFSTGKDDFLLTTSKATVELFQKHGYHPVFQESAGAHTWTNWREYLNQFAPQLFE
jgi:enterochelin esterase-like enzyme